MSPPKTTQPYNPFTLVDEVLVFARKIVTGLGAQGDIEAAALALANRLIAVIDDFVAGR